MMQGCPFCGGEAMSLAPVVTGIFVVACWNEKSCGARVFGRTPEEALAHWNQRVGLAPVAADALRDALISIGELTITVSELVLSAWQGIDNPKAREAREKLAQFKAGKPEL